MKNKKIMKVGLVIILLIMSVVLMSETVAEPPSNFSEPGAGLSVDNPYLISNLANLRWLSETMSAWGTATRRFHYLQTADIDATETRHWNQGAGFSPIGYGHHEEYLRRHFMSNYDGGGYTISNLYINRPNQDHVGLFGRVDRSVVSNLTLEGVYVIGYDYVGGMVGGITTDSVNINAFAWLNNNNVHGRVQGNLQVGGLVGSVIHRRTEVFHSYANVNVLGTDFVGGLIGALIQATIRESAAFGYVSGAWCVGGLIGMVAFGTSLNTPVINCFATGNVNGNDHVGGLVGYNMSGIIDKSYSIGVHSEKSNHP